MLDLIIIGGGPAGLAAGVKAASEGLKAGVFEASDRLGGRCASSARIENIPGFVGGVSGEEYGRALAAQLDQFGCAVRTGAKAIRAHGPFDRYANNDNQYPGAYFSVGGYQYHVKAKAVLVTAGLKERRLRELEAVDDRVRYSCRPDDLKRHRGEKLLFVGGGNSSAQLGLIAAENGATVTILAKRELKHNVSDWLLKQVEAHPNVHVVLGQLGTVWNIRGKLNAGIILNDELGSGGGHRSDWDHIYAFAGGEADTVFFDGDVADDGRILTGIDADVDTPYQTSLTGVFAAGDVRWGNTGSVAVAVGEGTQAVQTIAKVWLPTRYDALEPLARN